MTRAQEHLILSWTRKPRRKTTNWAEIVSTSLALHTLESSPFSEVQRYEAPGGKPFSVRLLCTAAAPESERFASSSTGIADILVVAPPPHNAGLGAQHYCHRSLPVRRLPPQILPR